MEIRIICPKCGHQCANVMIDERATETKMPGNIAKNMDNDVAKVILRYFENGKLAEPLRYADIAMEMGQGVSSKAVSRALQRLGIYGKRTNKGWVIYLSENDMDLLRERLEE